ncbi:MAG: citrate lyase subunit alpha, partial [Bacteroidetes bacterium]|nr:citrate lyase subunit alpha [Bacteroidota bacterium]
MNKFDKLVTNAAGRTVPTEINGKAAIPYMGVGKYRPSGRKAAPLISSCIDFPADGNKNLASLKEALI